MTCWVLSLGCGLIAVSLLGCSEATTPSAEIPTSEELLAAPTELVIENLKLLLDTDLVLSRMPSPGPFRGFNGEARVWERTQQALPAGLEMTRIWVLRGEEIWAGDSLAVITPQAAHEIRRWVASDQAWANVSVQVVVELVQGSRGFLLRAEDQWITVVI